MYYLFSLAREINEHGVECLTGESPVVPIVGYRDRENVSKVVFRVDERVVKYIVKSSGGVKSKQRFNLVGDLFWQRRPNGSDYLSGKLHGIPVVAYGKKDDVNVFVVFVDTKTLYDILKKKRDDGENKKPGETGKNPPEPVA